MPKKTIKLAVTAAALAMLLNACDSGPKTGGASPVPGGGKVLAEVNGAKITDEDMKAQASGLSQYAQKALGDEKNREKFLENLINRKLIVQEAEKRGVDKDPELVKALNQTKEELLWRLFLKNEVIAKVKVTDEDVKAYFDQKKPDLGSVRLSHILVASEPEAEDVLKQLKACQPFEKLARKYSLDTQTKGIGGDIGFVKWSQLGSASLKEAAFKLKPGEVSGIVQSTIGYHVLKVTDKKPAPDSDFASMKDSLKEDMLAEKNKDFFDALVKGLKDKSKVTENKDALKDLSFVQAQQQAPGLPAAESKTAK